MDNLKNRFSQEILQFLFFKIMVTKKNKKKQKREHNGLKRPFLHNLTIGLYHYPFCSVLLTKCSAKKRQNATQHVPFCSVLLTKMFR